MYNKGPDFDWEEMVVGKGCSEEEISRMRRCYPQTNIPDRGSPGLGQGSWRESTHRITILSLIFLVENDSWRRTSGSTPCQLALRWRAGGFWDSGLGRDLCLLCPQASPVRAD